MIIKEPKRFTAFFKKPILFFLSLTTIQKIIIVSLLGLGYSVGVYFIGAYHAISLLPQVSKQARSSEAPVRHRYNPLVSQPETIEIRVSDADLRAMLEKRNKALANGILLTSAEDYVPANIRHRGKVVRAKIRLKGDWTDHLDSMKWSFRISVNNGDTLLGMREFSIQHPKTRSYIYEWIFHEALAHEGLMHLRFDFIEVKLNNRNLGIYALEEHFDKLLIEHNRYREGPIVRFNEDLLWANRARGFSGKEEPGAYYASPIDAFQENKLKKNPKLMADFQKAFNLLERFRNGDLTAGQVFNTEHLAQCYALTDLFGGHHMTYFHNLRFYYNPVTSLLVPIVFDAGAGQRVWELIGVKSKYAENTYYDFGRRLFNDRDFMRLYVRVLNRIARPEYLDSFFGEIRPKMNKKLNILYKEFPNFPLLTDIFYVNAATIRDALNPVKGLHAYWDKAREGEVQLRLGNVQPFPLVIQGLEYKNRLVYRPDSDGYLEGKAPDGKVSYQSMRFRPVGRFILNDKVKGQLRVQYSIDGLSKRHNVAIFQTPRYQQDFMALDTIRAGPNISRFDFLEIDTLARRIYFKRGFLMLTEDLIIPAGYLVLARPGTAIDLTREAKIISYSPMLFQGNEENPVVVRSSDGTGQGMVVMKTEKKSVFEYVQFDNLSLPQYTGWSLTGSLTFYEAPVHFRRCKFNVNHQADDYLNVIRTEAVVEESQFSRTAFDAIDFDFVKGKVKNTTFMKCGNDALDFSGSDVELYNINISHALDKGISVGEASHVYAEDITIAFSKNALAVKDNSNMIVKRPVIKNCMVGFAVFQKKPEFGPASIEARDAVLESLRQPYAVQKGSSLKLDHILIRPR